MTYRELRDKLNKVSENKLDGKILVYDNYVGDVLTIEAGFDFSEVPEEVQADFEEDAGLIFIKLPQ